MIRFLVGFALFLLLGASGSAQQSMAQQIAAHAATIGADLFAFTATTKVEPSGADAKPVTRVETFDPSRPPAARWKLVSVDGRTPTPKEVKEAAKGRSDAVVPSYSRLALYVGKPTGFLDAERGRAILNIETVPKGVFMIGKKDISSDVRARAFIDPSAPQPWVENVEIETKRPVSMMMVAKIESLKIRNRFKRLADGRPVPAEQVSTLVGSMFGKSGTIKTTIIFSDHREVR